MRTYALVVVAAAGCSSSPAAAPPAPSPVAAPVRDAAPTGPVRPSAKATAFHAIAKTTHPLSLVQGPGRVAIFVDGHAWVTAHDGALGADTAIARDLAAGASKLPGGDLHVGWGRTPVMFDARKSALVARVGGKYAKAPGLVVAVVALGNSGEVWALEDRQHHGAIAIADAHDHAKALSPLPRLGAPVPGLAAEFAEACTQPTVWRLVPHGSDVIAGIVECSIEAPFRMQVIHGDGTATVRQLASMESAGHLQAEDFAVSSDGAPIVAGQLPDGKLVIARGRDDGSWAVMHTAITETALVGIAIAADDAAWTISLGAGPDDHDAWTLARDGVPVELHDLAGAPLRPYAIAADAVLGIVVEASDGNVDHPTWVLAEHPLDGRVLDIP